MIHITFTGPYVGEVVCGKDKALAKNDGDRFAHIGAWIDNKELDICKDCLKLWNEAEGETK